jgi:type II secretory pathway pseudopilin PulG
MTIIGIIGTIILPHLMKARCQAQLTACQLNLKAIATAVQTYEVQQYQVYPDDLTYSGKNSFWIVCRYVQADGKELRIRTEQTT